MSNAIVAHDMLLLMENEYSNMLCTVIEEICSTYSLDISEVKSMLGKKMSITFDINDNVNNYRLVQRKGSICQNKLKDEERCIANLYDFSLKAPRRCSRARSSEECLFCSVHLRMHISGRLKLYGVAKEYAEEYQNFCDNPSNHKNATSLQPLPGLKKQVVRKVK